MIRPKLLTALGDSGVYIGEREYVTGNGTFYFTVPQAVRRIHACAVGAGAQGAVNGIGGDYEYDWDGGGGGGLGWANNIEVEPGEVLCITVGRDCGIKRTEEDNVTETGEWLVAGLYPTRSRGYGEGGLFVGDGGGRGGNGSASTSVSGLVDGKGSGGGAGGYRGSGGPAKTVGGGQTPFSGGGGSGGHSTHIVQGSNVRSSTGRRGGGVGIRGEGASGAPAIPDSYDWDDNYTGKAGNPGSGGDKYEFGAGGAGEKNGWDGDEDTRAGRGAVRIIWGNRFSYPDNADVEA